MINLITQNYENITNSLLISNAKLVSKAPCSTAYTVPGSPKTVLPALLGCELWLDINSVLVADVSSPLSQEVTASQATVLVQGQMQADKPSISKQG